jgi:hypothetical protein
MVGVGLSGRIIRTVTTGRRIEISATSLTVHRHFDRREQTRAMNADDSGDDPVPPGLVLDLDEAFRVLEALETHDWRCGSEGRHPGCRMSWRRVIRLLHGRLGLDEGGVL